MIDNEAWLELAEVSPSTLAALQAKSGNALQVSVGSVSILVEALEGSSSNDAMKDSSILWIHPTLYDFLDEANELQDKEYSPQQNKDSAIVQARLAPLPMEPPPAAAWSSILDDDSKTTSISATLSKTIIQVIPDKSCLQIACVHLDPGVRVVIQNDDPTSTELQSLLSIGLQGRLVLIGAFLMSLTPHGMIILQVTGIQNSSQGRHQQPIDTSISIAYRLGHSSSFALQIINPLFMIEDPSYEQEQEKSASSKEQEWETNIPGYEPLLQDVDQLMSISTRAASPSGILITGCAGVGKTRLVSCLCGSGQAAPGRIHWLSAQDLILRASTESDLLINLVLPPSSNNCSLWVIDDLHLLARSEDADEYEATNVEYMLVLNAIVQAMDQLQQQNPNTTLIGIAQTASDLPKELTKIGRLEKEISMHPPTQLQRTTIWEHLLQRDDVAVEFQQPWASALAAATGGCVVADLVRIYQDAATRAWARGGDDEESSRVIWVWEDLQEAARMCVPSQLALLDVTKPVPSAIGLSWTEIHDQSWGTFGGYSSIRKRVFRHVVAPWRRFLRGVESSLQVEKGMDPPPGVLFHGPSGCGKTFAAKCLAASLELPVITVRAADVLDKWLGGSESILRSLFARARAAAPCILFLDEIDSIASNRSEGDSNDFTSRVLSTFLNEMDGVSSAVTKSRVLVVACTNRLESLDAALLRPGRLEEHLHLELPSTEDLEEILKLFLARIPLDGTVNLQVLAQELYEKAATGADVEGLCREVCLIVLRESTDPETVVVTQDDLLGAIIRFRPE